MEIQCANRKAVNRKDSSNIRDAGSDAKYREDQTNVLLRKESRAIDNRQPEEEKCPKCGYGEVQIETCSKCGLIFSKYYEVEARKRMISSVPNIDNQPALQTRKFIGSMKWCFYLVGWY